MKKKDSKIKESENTPKVSIGFKTIDEIGYFEGKVIKSLGISRELLEARNHFSSMGSVFSTYPRVTKPADNF